MNSSQLVEKPGPVGLALILLTVLLAGAFLQLYLTGRLEAVRVEDTPSYMEASRASSLKAALSTHRTVGLPTLIRSLYRFGSSTASIPTLGVLTYFLGVVLFFHAVHRFTGSVWLAFAAAAPLPFAGLMNLVSLLQPDFLAGSFTLIAVSCLLLVVVRPRNPWVWVGLGANTVLAYQFRPAAQFLVLLLPLCAGWFLWLREGAPLGTAFRLAAITAVVTLVPFLLICSLRAVTVGSLGVVSFGGSNVASCVVNFLDRELVEELPSEQRTLGRKILQQRRQRGWEPMRLDSDPIEHFRQGSDNLFRIARNVAKQESRKAERQGEIEPRDPEISVNVDLDRRLTELATQIIRLRPALYLYWVRSAFKYGMRQLFDYVWILGPFVLLLLSVPIAWIRGRMTPEASQESRSSFPGSLAADLTMLSSLALSYYFVYLLLVSCTYFPFERYFVSLTLFLPSALVACLFVVWRRTLRARQRLEPRRRNRSSS